MGKKIFVSYKYGDANVASLGLAEQTTARHYVDQIQLLLAADDHINKGEADGESLQTFKDDTIASKLRDKIFDSSLTIVVISKAMKDAVAEDDQWIPYEVAYSLKEHTRNDRTSKSNAMLAVVLPDHQGGYGYFIQDEACPYCKCRILWTNTLFGVLRRNMFNIRRPELISCANHVTGGNVYAGYSSYIHTVKWTEFASDVSSWLAVAETINDRIDAYNISKEV